VSANKPCTGDDVKIRILGDKIFGYPNDCVQSCLPRTEVRFIKSAVEGSCEDVEFTILVKKEEMVTELSPMPLPMEIFTRAGEGDYNCPPGADTKVVMIRKLALEYGAESDKQCSEMCMPAAVVGYLPGAEKDTCKHRGFRSFMMDTSVTKMGMPVAIKVFGIKLVPRKAVPEKIVVECGRGTSNVVVTNQEIVSDYGGSYERGAQECVEMCLETSDVALIPGAAKGTCDKLGYTVSKGPGMARSMELRREVEVNLFTVYKPDCPRLMKPFSASKCVDPIMLGWFMNAFGTCTDAIGCGSDRKTYARKLFRTKYHCEQAASKYC
jgi:hypothetical protein